MRRLLTPLGGLLAFSVIALLVVGGLGWLTVVALRVEAAQLEASARADAANKERLALWQLDGRMFPTLGAETNRPYAHYFATYIPYPVVLPEDAGPNAEPLPVPSPLLSGDLPDWMLLHFQADADAGWTSPQVISPDQEAKLRAQAVAPLSLANVTPRRRELLAELRTAFPKEGVPTLFDWDESDPTDSPLAVPLNTAEPQSVPAPAPDAAPVAGGGVGSVESRNRFNFAPGQPAEAKPAEGTERGRNTFGRGGLSPAAPGGVPAPAPTAPPGFGVPAPADPAAVQQPRQGETTAQTGNVPAPTRGGLARQVPDPGAANSNAYDNRRAMLNKVLQEAQAQARPGNDVSQLGLKAGEQPAPAQVDAAKKVRGKDGATVPGEKPVAPPPPAPDGYGRGVGPGGGFGGMTTPAPKARGGATVPADRDRGDAMRAESKKAKDETTAMKREAGKSDTRKEAEALAEQKSVEELGSRQLALGAEPRAKVSPPAGPQAGGRGQGLAKRFAPHLQPPAVHLGAMRPQWLHAPDGTAYLLLVRAARLENKTVFQGIVLDWPRLREVLQDEVRPLFPAARLEPVLAAADASDRTMTALPARLDPGPVSDPPPAGWTALRLGLVIAWVAALVALAAVGFGGWSLIDLSERRIRFVSAVTHELRTPLTSLRLYLDLLTSGMIQDEEKQREYLTTLHGESERLNRLIENVLDFARLEKRSVQAHRQPVKVADLLDQVKQTWADRCAGDGKDLVVVSTLPPGQEVCTDARVAAQILGNLIDNARKYTREAADRRIWLWAKPGGRKQVVLEVEDRGPGVAAAERCTIFRPFRRGRAADTTAGGAGLGLALAKQWAEVLGWSLTCRAADGGVGACFRLELPVK